MKLKAQATSKAKRSHSSISSGGGGGLTQEGASWRTYAIAIGIALMAIFYFYASLHQFWWMTTTKEIIFNKYLFEEN